MIKKITFLTLYLFISSAQATISEEEKQFIFQDRKAMIREWYQKRLDQDIKDIKNITNHVSPEELEFLLTALEKGCGLSFFCNSKTKFLDYNHPADRSEYPQCKEVVDLLKIVFKKTQESEVSSARKKLDQLLNDSKKEAEETNNKQN